MNLNDTMKKLMLLISFLLLPTIALAQTQNITNPQIVSNMVVDIVETGSVSITGPLDSLELNLSIPQDDEYQDISTFEVSDQNENCNTATCSYKFIFDKYDNKLLQINWKNLKSSVTFSVRSVVSINRRAGFPSKNFTDFLLPTSLVQSLDPTIAQLAAIGRGNDFDKVAILSEWINQNVQYDTVYSDVSLSATQVLNTRKGVCKEFSNLLVSLTRNTGFYSAVAVGFVHPGRVYKGDKFEPHGWAEVYTSGGIVADPTWAEVGYLDATHIKFATLPDSNWIFETANGRGFGSFSITLGQINTTVRVLSFKESPLVTVSSSLLADTVGEGYAVVKTDLTTNRCLLTRVDSFSCLDQNRNEFLTSLNPTQIPHFCDQKSIFSIFKVPESLSPSLRYTCPLSIVPYAGDQQNVQVTISRQSAQPVKLFLDRTTVVPGEKITATATNAHLFTDSGSYGLNSLEIIAPTTNFTVFAYSGGSLAQQNVTVINIKPFDVALSVPSFLKINVPNAFNVLVKNLFTKNQTVSVRSRGTTQVRTIGTEAEIFNFTFTPANKDDNVIQVIVSSSDFSTTVSKVVPVEGSFFYDIIDAITNFFSTVINAITNLFRR